MKRVLTGIFLSFLLLSLSGSTKVVEFSLMNVCPQSHILNVNMECKIESRYDNYRQNNKKWAGELHRPLPKPQDGYTPEQIDLGRYLFFDPVLSAGGKVSCATCHQPENSFSNKQARSLHGDGSPGKRSTPSLWNLAYQKLYGWDASTMSLEDQARITLFSKDMMANTEDNLLKSIRAIPEYRQMFKKAFPSGFGEIDLSQIITALAAFESSLVSLNSRYDQYVHGNIKALTPKEVRGMNIFRSYVARCAECHTPPLFTNNEVAITGVMGTDKGAGEIYSSDRMNGAFKIPSLRNVASTAPYMHAGQYATLREAVAHYNTLDKKSSGVNLDSRVSNTRLSDEEIDLLVAFLKTLSDESNMPEIPAEVPSGLKFYAVDSLD